MSFDEFLNLTKVIRMLYGTGIAGKFFELNIGSFYHLSLDDLTKKLEESKIGTSHTNS